MNRLVMQLGFVLLFLALVTGLIVSSLTTPRLGLAAHTVGFMGGIFLVVLGAVDSAFTLGPRAASIMTWSWVYAAYANWLACLIGGITGASRLTPIAGAGASGSPTAEVVVALLLQTLAVASLLGAALAMWGLRGRGA